MARRETRDPDRSKNPRKDHPLGPTFGALLVATSISNLGDGLRLTALPLLATTLTSSPLLISGVTAAQFLPWATFAPFGGVIVDRADRRRLIMITQAWRASLIALLAVAVLSGEARIWHLFVVAFMITVGEILVDPAVVATVPTLVRPDDLDRANGQISTVEIVTNEFAGGPVGALTFGLAPSLPFLLDALSYLGSIVPFGRLPANEARPGRDTESGVLAELGGGLRWIRSHPFLWPLVAATAVFHLGTAGAFSMLILLTTDVLGGSDFAFGLVLAAAAAGATGASLVAARLAARFGRRTVMTTVAVITALSVIVSGIVTTIWQLGIVWALHGATSGVLLAIGRGFVQRHTPNELLGRAAIAQRMITRSSFVVGALIAGLIATATSVRGSFVVAGLLHLVGALLIWRSFRHESTEPSNTLAAQPSQ